MALTAEQALAVAMSYTEESLTGAGAIKGKPGRDGADGKSAYEVAVDNGFVGTESEWLASLNGADGADGQDGADATDAQVAQAVADYMEEHPISGDIDDTTSSSNTTYSSAKIEQLLEDVVDDFNASILGGEG